MFVSSSSRSPVLSLGLARKEMGDSGSKRGREQVEGCLWLLPRHTVEALSPRNTEQSKELLALFFTTLPAPFPLAILCSDILERWTC